MKLRLILASLAAGTLPAAAADIVVSIPGVPAPSMPSPLEPYNWSGFYGGAHIGYGRGHESDNQSRHFPSGVPSTPILPGGSLIPSTPVGPGQPVIPSAPILPGGSLIPSTPIGLSTPSMPWTPIECGKVSGGDEGSGKDGGDGSGSGGGGGDGSGGGEGDGGTGSGSYAIGGFGPSYPDENGQCSNSGESLDRYPVSGLIGGLHAGYNQQFGQLVLGLEADIDYANIHGSLSGGYGNGRYRRSLELESRWQGSMRARAGYAIDRLLPYATGGLAIADGKLKSSGFNGDTAIASTSSHNTHVGWTLGAGAEYAFTDHLIGRTEVRYTGFQTKTYDTSDGPVKAGWDQWTVNFGMSYKF